MAKRPRMQAKPSRLHMALPLTSFRQNRREENRRSTGLGSERVPNNVSVLEAD